MSSLAPAMALRESFGDRKVPDITRKITACVACRKQKIKCRMTNSSPPCTRCRKRGLSCTVNKSLQMLLESDVSWKDSIEKRMSRMETMVNKLARERPEEEFSQHESQIRSREAPDGHMDAQIQDSASTRQIHERTPQPWEIVVDPASGPGDILASSVSEVVHSSSVGQQGLIGSNYSDLVSQGLISLANAEGYFGFYRQRLDPLVYNVLAEHDSLASIRGKSALLVAVVCTVSALHSASPDYGICYQKFRNEFAAQLLGKHNSFDDVRALCIGAFFLSDLSWSLSGAAVRIATEINLHRCITKIPHIKRACYVRTRLYFLVYVCDHHFSVAYGRPPMTREFGSLGSPTAFLESAFATEEDTSLVSQIEIWSINSRVFDTFGVDPERVVPDTLLPQLRRLNIALDTWRADWTDRLGRSDPKGNPSTISVDLHFWFAKLYLCSHVFRRTQPENDLYQLSSRMEEFANLGIVFASSIIRVTIDDHELQTIVGDLPAYFDTMLAFAAVFLLKLTQKCPLNVKIDKQEIFGMIEQLIIVLRNATAGMHAQHFLHNVKTSIDRLLHATKQQQQSTSAVLDGIAGAPNDQDWLVPPPDSGFLANYDFFWPQDTDLEFDFSTPDNIPPAS